LLFASPAFAQNAQDAAIRAAVRTFETGWNNHDMSAMFQEFTPDAEFVNIVGMYWRGLPEVKRAHQVMHDAWFRNVPNHIEDLQVRVVAADAAIAVVRWKKGGFTSPDGIVHPESRDLMSMFLVKRDGRWLIAGAHNTPIDEMAAKFDPAARRP
jgi:uncharacterized protein (TIGR02246 family)